MTAFHETALAQRFLEHTLPSAVRELARLADQVGELTDVLRGRDVNVGPDQRSGRPSDMRSSTASVAADSLPCVLIVDDDQLCRSGLARALKPRCRVVHAGSAEEALTVLASTAVDVVLTDFNMPGHDGLWLLDRVRSTHPAVTRFLMSGQEIPNAPDLVQAGLIKAFVTKPATREALVAALGLREP